MIHQMVDRIKEYIDPPFTPLVVRVRLFFWAVREEEGDADHPAWEFGARSWGYGGGFPTMYQAQSNAGPSINTTPLLAQTLWQNFVAMPWWSWRCSRIVLENAPRRHVSCRKYLCMPLEIIILIVFSSLSSPVRPCKFWFITWHTWGKVSPDLVCTLESNSLRWSTAGVLPP